MAAPRLDGVDWDGTAETNTYRDSKLFVAVLVGEVARRRPERAEQRGRPGWVPTKMGGAGASGDIAARAPAPRSLATTTSPGAAPAAVTGSTGSGRSRTRRSRTPGSAANSSRRWRRRPASPSEAGQERHVDGQAAPSRSCSTGTYRRPVARPALRARRRSTDGRVHADRDVPRDAGPWEGPRSRRRHARAGARHRCRDHGPEFGPQRGPWPDDGWTGSATSRPSTRPSRATHHPREPLVWWAARRSTSSTPVPRKPSRRRGGPHRAGRPHGGRVQPSSSSGRPTWSTTSTWSRSDRARRGERLWDGLEGIEERFAVDDGRVAVRRRAPHVHARGALIAGEGTDRS